MNTKEAIEANIGYLEILNKKPTGSKIIFDAYTKRSFNNIIDLLKRGEKFEKMWNHLYWRHDNNISLILNPSMDKIKQKYFPKGG